jgi:hypothetical protein
MIRSLLYGIPLLLLTATAIGKEPAGSDAKVLGGMSIVGNDDAPKSLVIVPWKSSDLGHAIGVSRLLDDGRQPVDRDVFLRELDYYQIRAASPGAHSPGGQ